MPRRLRTRLAQLRREQSGSVAVEFGLVATPFFLILCAIMAAAMQILAQQTLDDRLDDAGRALFTGTFQKGANATKDAPSRLKELMCAGMTTFNCSLMRVEVTTGTAFSNPSSREAYDPNTGKMTDGFGSKFTCPTGDQIVTIRAAVPVSSYFRLLNVNGIRLDDGTNLLTSTAVFRTEPYTLSSC